MHAYRRDPHDLIAIIWHSDTKVGSFSQLDNNRFLYGLYIYLCMTCYETVWFGTVEVTVELVTDIRLEECDGPISQ